jgi:hypothetical protein
MKISINSFKLLDLHKRTTARTNNIATTINNGPDPSVNISLLYLQYFYFVTLILKIIDVSLKLFNYLIL